MHEITENLRNYRKTLESGEKNENFMSETMDENNLSFEFNHFAYNLYRHATTL